MYSPPLAANALETLAPSKVEQLRAPLACPNVVDGRAGRTGKSAAFYYMVDLLARYRAWYVPIIVADTVYD